MGKQKNKAKNTKTKLAPEPLPSHGIRKQSGRDFMRTLMPYSKTGIHATTKFGEPISAHVTFT